MSPTRKCLFVTPVVELSESRQCLYLFDESTQMASDDADKVSSLKGKVTLITGASSGIGAGTSVLFAKLGALLALNGRDVESLKKVAKECKGCGGGAEPLLVPGDLTDKDTVKRTVEEVIARFGRLDVLVNSAGILAMGGIETSDLATYDRVMNINVRSVYHLTQLCVPHLVETKGSIVNVSSVNGQRSFPGVLAYCMSKSAIDQFTRCVALELASKQVRVNSVCPGVIVTDVHKRAGLDEEQYAKFLEKCKQTHALGRPGEVDEVAHSIAFLASDAASFITGVNLPIDGGRHAMCPR
ncbi:3-oxoacyl-[acyl-carrier-protein] reductase FabG [Phyllopteryx taeniolatus]|uniref:3-oxoacyl-[acyl-carrier-protein] reductase FabG n=2 Tax=Syngnathinae TaxID=129914 RepID=UPI002AD26CFC|nr:3-oxoacyl-[acyl-carrier-protein] reductase FabG [Phyllopteryx taeniolatus]